jgi:hypothetical protein
MRGKEFFLKVMFNNFAILPIVAMLMVKLIFCTVNNGVLRELHHYLLQSTPLKSAVVLHSVLI